MKLIIAGSRDLTLTYPLSIADFVNYFTGHAQIEEVISGGAKGIDTQGEQFCMYRGSKLKKFEADWYTHGKAAGPIRNRQMAKYGDALLLIWDGESRGSSNMRDEMAKLNKPIYEVILRRENDKDIK